MEIFRHDGALVADEYFSGHYSWGTRQLLSTASLVCRPPVSGTVEIALEIGGVLEEDRTFVVPAIEQPEFRVTLALNEIVEIGEEVRFKVTAFDGEPGDEAINAAITLVSVPESMAGCRTLTDFDLWVRWVDGDEVLRLFDYFPLTHVFVESQPGIATGRATLTNGGPDTTFTIAIQAVDAMSVVSGQLRVNEFNERFVPTGIPRLEFMEGQRRLAALTKTGVLYVAHLVEATAAPGDDRFEFYSGGQLSAVFGPGQLVTGEDLREPV